MVVVEPVGNRLVMVLMARLIPAAGAVVVAAPVDPPHYLQEQVAVVL
jgi:hypothetical protein